MTTDTFYRRLQIAGSLVAGGLVVEIVTLNWIHPLAFVTFIVLGGALVTAGILLYLFTIVSR